ncbi:MAG: hypothetical protein ACJ0SL_04580 [Candidatus Rariloculaceae bacterium]
MKNVRAILMIVVGSLFVSPLILAQRNPSAELERAAVEAIDQNRGFLSQVEEALIKEQVLHVVNKYYEFAASGDVERIAAETHMVPWLILSRDEVYDSVEATTSRYAERRRTGPSNWAKSTYNARNVCVLSNASAITSGYNVRSTADGDIISVEGVAYVLMKTSDGWRIVAFSGTSPQRVIRCEDEY